MKLGSLKSGRDGRLVVVSQDLAWCADAGHLVPSLQAALDAWEHVAPLLQNLSVDLAHEAIPMMRFHERNAAAPLPRAYHRARAAAGGPDLVQAASDRFLGPRDAITLTEAGGASFEAEIVVITADVPRGADAATARDAILLVGLANEVGSGASALSPVFVTPDELGDSWGGGQLGGEVKVELNGARVGEGGDANGPGVDLGELVARLAAGRSIAAGTIIGSGGNRGVAAGTLAQGDTVRIWMEDASGHPIFGTIEQVVEQG
jgi:fumarylacetoacetate (FAA) hydrolase